MLHILSGVWVLPTPKAGQNMLLSCILLEKAEKGKKTKKLRLDSNLNGFELDYIQWGLEYRTCSVFGWFKVVRF